MNGIKNNEVSEDKVADNRNMKEKLYDKVALTKRQLDIIIVMLIISFVAFFVLGALKGNGII